MNVNSISKLLRSLQVGALLCFCLGASADPVILDGQLSMLQALSEFHGAVLFLGHGSKGQFADMARVHDNVDSLVARYNATFGTGKWVALFGGDNFNPEKPDIAHVMKYLKDTHNVRIMAIQSDIVIPWGGVDKYIDFVRYIPTVELPVLDNQGHQVVEDGKPKSKTHWGGLVSGVPRGPTEIYLGQDLIGGTHPILKEVVAVGGGLIGLEEARYAYEHSVPVTYVRAEARFPEVNGQFGSLDEWATQIVGNIEPGECARLLVGKVR